MSVKRSTDVGVHRDARSIYSTTETEMCARVAVDTSCCGWLVKGSTYTIKDGFELHTLSDGVASDARCAVRKDDLDASTRGYITNT